jgi:hypothetical protein
MSKPLFRPPKHVIKEWPEIFEDLYMNTWPVAYLETVHFIFEDGRIWQIDIANQLDCYDADTVAEKMLETLQEYKNDIKTIDFKLDIKKLKKDIKDSTDQHFK